MHLKIESEKAPEEVETIVQFASDASFHAGKLCRHVKGIGCERLMEDSRDEALAAQELAKTIARTTSSSSVLEAVLYEKTVLAGLWRQMTMGLSQTVCSSSKNVSERPEYSVAAFHGQDTEKTVRERVMGSARGDVRWSGDCGDLPRSFADVIQVQSDKTVMSLKINALVTNTVYAV